MISYYFEDTDFIFKGKTLNNRWLRLVAESEIRRIGDISIIFCSDNYILDVNQQYLHEKIGAGTLGLEAIRRIVTHPKLKDLPFILETPHDTLEGYAREIALLRQS